MKMLDAFKAARRAGTPILAIKTSDPEATMLRIQQFNQTTPVIQWDCIQGWQSRNGKLGQDAIDAALASAETQLEATVNFAQHLVIAEHLPFDEEAKDTTNPILFVLNGHKYFDEKDFVQALWNLRDPFKFSLRSVVLLGPDFNLPSELQQDILILDEPLPTEQELGLIVKTIAKKRVNETNLPLAVNALLGLGAFPAESATAMSLTRSGLDIESMWERKRQMISAAEALSVYSGKETFADIGGCEQVKKFMSGVINGREAPRVIVFIDEGEKMFSGAVGDVQDSSGTSQDSLGTTLKFMEDHEADGAIFVGPPGAAKSAIAKATGNEAGIPTIVLDIGAAKGSLVGESEMKIRNAYKVIDAVGGGRVYFIMTCNKIAVLPPELKRRFTSGIFYFEIPDAYSNYTERIERDCIWSIYTKKYDIAISPSTQVDDKGWTGAEIRNCCRLAYRQKISLTEASEYIIPVSKSAASQIDALRKEASGRYLCANQPGTYQFKEGTPTRAARGERGRMIATQDL